MLTPAYANTWVYHTPVGKTPAVCLTQALPPETKGKILLLGCGDLRNILFTAYCDGRLNRIRRFAPRRRADQLYRIALDGHHMLRLRAPS